MSIVAGRGVEWMAVGVIVIDFHLLTNRRTRDPAMIGTCGEQPFPSLPLIGKLLLSTSDESYLNFPPATLLSPACLTDTSWHDKAHCVIPLASLTAAA